MRRRFLMIWGADDTPLARKAVHRFGIEPRSRREGLEPSEFPLFCRAFLNLKPNASGLGGLGIILRALLMFRCWRGKAPGIPFLGRRFLVTGRENPTVNKQ